MSKVAKKWKALVHEVASVLFVSALSRSLHFTEKGGKRVAVKGTAYCRGLWGLTQVC